MSEPWFEAMRNFYRDLDEELSGLEVSCRGCGCCCHFDVVDHILYASGLEQRYLVRVAGPQPLADAEPEQLAWGLRCPYQSGGRCQAREGRALGCRLYHCDWPDGVDEDMVYQRWHERLKRLHDELGEEWDYRPLLPLNGA